MRNYLRLPLPLLVAANVFATSPMTDLGVLDNPPYAADLYSVALLSSRDGRVIGGLSSDGEGISSFIFENGALSRLQDFSAGQYPRMHGMSADGSVIVGQYTFGGGLNPQNSFFYQIRGSAPIFVYNSDSHGGGIRISPDGSTAFGGTSFEIALGAGLGINAFFYRPSAGITYLSPEGTWRNTFIDDFSDDGSIIVGRVDRYSSLGDSFTERVFKYQGGSLGLIGTLPGELLDGQQRVAGLSANGAVLAGTYLTLTGVRSFRHTNGTGLTDIGSLGGNPADMTVALDLSRDGTTIVGESLIDGIGLILPFKFVQGRGMTELTLPGGGRINGGNARFVSDDGMVTVILAGDAENGVVTTYRHTDSTDAVDIGSLGGTYTEAKGISGDGTTIFGESSLASGGIHAFIWRDNTMVDVDSWLASVAGPAGVMPSAMTLASLPLEGAHHRTLLSYGLPAGGTQWWATGDLGDSRRIVDRRLTSGEIGLGAHLAPNLAGGFALGYGDQWQGLASEGRMDIHGTYQLGELDLAMAHGGVFSLTLMAGQWDASLRRGYVVGGGGLDFSEGSTELSSFTARLRYDSQETKLWSQAGIAGHLSYERTRISNEAFTESGGAFPASFDEQRHNRQEGRLGLTFRQALSSDDELRILAEWCHRFDDRHPDLVGVGPMGAFSLAGQAVLKDQMRVGIDWDHRLDDRTKMIFSVHATGRGEGHDVSGAFSLRRNY